MMLGRNGIKPGLEVSLVSVCAALYAALGYLTYLGIFAPVFGTVRFWPSVIVPAAFSILFSPRIGGIGAAVGIFISDMLIHGNPVLSLTVGVPANFVAFYLMGWLAQRWRNRDSAVLAILIQLIPVAGCAVIYFLELIDLLTALIYLAVSIIVVVFTMMLALAQRRFLGIAAASSLGLMTGSAIIGIGLWAYSQFFILPGGIRNAPVIFALGWFLWTYLTEIPFIQFFLPPILKAVSRAVPSRGVLGAEERVRT
jgi:uncharacterized membrane protein